MAKYPRLKPGLIAIVDLTKQEGILHSWDEYGSCMVRFPGPVFDAFHLTALILRRPPRRYRTQIEYDTWDGWVTGWIVFDTQTRTKYGGPYPRNRASYLARKLNEQDMLSQG
jgi:hypothetical protein